MLHTCNPPVQVNECHYHDDRLSLTASQHNETSLASNESLATCSSARADSHSKQNSSHRQLHAISLRLPVVICKDSSIPG